MSHRNRGHCRPGTGATSQTVTHLPDPRCQASTGAAPTGASHVRVTKCRHLALLGTIRRETAHENMPI